VRRVERVEDDGLGVQAAPQAGCRPSPDRRQLRRANGAGDHQLRVLKCPSDVHEQVARRRVQPLDVVDRDPDQVRTTEVLDEPQ